MKTAIVNLATIVTGDWRDPIASGDTILMADGKIVEVGTVSADKVEACDVVIDAGLYTDAMPAVLSGSTLWAFAEYQLVRAGELRLDLEAGRVVGAHDRHIDLDEAVPQAKELARIQREARAAIDAWQAEAYGGR